MLPNELWTNILLRLNIPFLQLVCRRVSRGWRALTDEAIIRLLPEQLGSSVRVVADELNQWGHLFKFDAMDNGRVILQCDKQGWAGIDGGLDVHWFPPNLWDGVCFVGNAKGSPPEEEFAIDDYVDGPRTALSGLWTFHYNIQPNDNIPDDDKTDFQRKRDQHYVLYLMYSTPRVYCFSKLEAELRQLLCWEGKRVINIAESNALLDSGAVRARKEKARLEEEKRRGEEKGRGQKGRLHGF
ncbi:hypothetical protein HK104_009603 [Borealophlyctis nickersoniae]|nr:hypothetical protein HK104_009603 [Borealophlyctis nickersoniae]